MAGKNRKTTSGGQTVEIDREAYQRLQGARSGGESFSEVIKRYVCPRQSAEEVLRAMRGARISSSTLRAIEDSASRRRKIVHKSKG